MHIQQCTIIVFPETANGSDVNTTEVTDIRPNLLHIVNVNFFYNFWQDPRPLNIIILFNYVFGKGKLLCIMLKYCKLKKNLLFFLLVTASIRSLCSTQPPCSFDVLIKAINGKILYFNAASFVIRLLIKIFFQNHAC